MQPPPFDREDYDKQQREGREAHEAQKQQRISQLKVVAGDPEALAEYLVELEERIKNLER